MSETTSKKNNVIFFNKNLDPIHKLQITSALSSENIKITSDELKKISDYSILKYYRQNSPEGRTSKLDIEDRMFEILEPILPTILDYEELKNYRKYSTKWTPLNKAIENQMLHIIEKEDSEVNDSIENQEGKETDLENIDKKCWILIKRISSATKGGLLFEKLLAKIKAIITTIYDIKTLMARLYKFGIFISGLDKDGYHQKKKIIESMNDYDALSSIRFSLMGEKDLLEVIEKQMLKVIKPELATLDLNKLDFISCSSLEGKPLNMAVNQCIVSIISNDVPKTNDYDLLNSHYNQVMKIIKIINSEKTKTEDDKNEDMTKFLDLCTQTAEDILKKIKTSFENNAITIKEESFSILISKIKKKENIINPEITNAIISCFKGCVNAQQE